MNLNTEHRRMEDKSVTAFLLSPHYRTCRHLLLQIIVLLMTINVFWYEPLQSVSFWRRFGGFLAYFVSINTVIYMNLYILVPCFLLKNRLGHYVLTAVLTNLVVIVFLSVTQGLLFEVILPGKNPGRFATFINTFSGILTIGFVTAGSAAISLFTHWLRYNLRIDELESTTLQSELTFLKNQINPHFLYNSLSLINWKALEIGSDDISKATLALSRYYRTSLNKGKNTMSIREEIDNVRSYLQIQEMFHDYSFTVKMDVAEDILDYRTLNLILQPLAENAIAHGIDRRRGSEPGVITISGRRDGDCVVLSVADNGVGMEQEKAQTILTEKSSGYGVRNVNSRIQLEYGEAYGLSIESEPGKGTKVTVRIPGVEREVQA